MQEQAPNPLAQPLCCWDAVAATAMQTTQSCTPCCFSSSNALIRKQHMAAVAHAVCHAAAAITALQVHHSLCDILCQLPHCHLHCRARCALEVVAIILLQSLDRHVVRGLSLLLLSVWCCSHHQGASVSLPIGAAGPAPSQLRGKAAACRQRPCCLLQLLCTHRCS